MRLGRGVVVTVVDHSVEGFDGVALGSGLFAACQSPGEVLAAKWARLGGGGGCFWWCVDPSSVTDSVIAAASVLFAVGVVLVHVVLLVVGAVRPGLGGPPSRLVVGLVVLPALLTRVGFASTPRAGAHSGMGQPPYDGSSTTGISRAPGARGHRSRTVGRGLSSPPTASRRPRTFPPSSSS